MPDRRIRRTARCLAGLAILVPLASAAPPSLGSIPFWNVTEGCWLSENHYLNPAMEPNIPTYASVTCITVTASQIIERETKFYPASNLAESYGGDLARDGEGVEVVKVNLATATGADGAVRTTNSGSSQAIAGQLVMTIPVAPDTAMVTIRNQNDYVDHYRMFITLPTKDRRYIVNLGIVGEPSRQGEVGDLRGMAIFKQSRIDANDAEPWRNRLRTRFAVGVRVTELEDGTLLREPIRGDDDSTDLGEPGAARPDQSRREE